MGGDPNFRLKLFVVIAGVLGVFLVSYVAQRAWYWMKTRRREDVETSRLEPIIDFSLLAFGGVVIWLAIEGLVLSVTLSNLLVLSYTKVKIGEIEVGQADAQSGKLTLLFYPADEAGQRRREERVPVFTSGSRFELEVESIEWRGAWNWLGDRGFFQFRDLRGWSATAGDSPRAVDLSLARVPRGVGALLFLQQPRTWQAKPAQDCKPGEIYEVFLGDVLEIKLAGASTE